MVVDSKPKCPDSKEIPNLLTYPSQGEGGPNVFGIGRMGRVNGYLIKDVFVKIKIKLKSFPDNTKSRMTIKTKFLYEIPKVSLVVSYICCDIR